MRDVRSNMKPWMVVGAGAALAWLGWQQLSPTISTDTPTALRYEASDLAARFASNQAAAHAGISGRMVEVHGPAHVITVVGDAPVLSIGVLFRNVDCMLPPAAMRAAGRIQRGDQVRVKGRVVAAGAAVMLRPCVLM